MPIILSFVISVIFLESTDVFTSKICMYVNNHHKEDPPLIPHILPSLCLTPSPAPPFPSCWQLIFLLSEQHLPLRLGWALEKTYLCDPVQVLDSRISILLPPISLASPASSFSEQLLGWVGRLRKAIFHFLKLKWLFCGIGSVLWWEGRRVCHCLNVPSL